ncbi:MAG: discoidin domain-containing protein [Clostridia bacterium]|nr:discoidin domain-containing protein [Clostridia bacterium]
MIEKDIRDRVPTYPGRILLRPVADQPNYFEFVRADDPTEEGTPLDRATFMSIIHSRLAGRYYTPTVSKSTVGAQAFKINPIPASGWVLDATENKGTSGAYTVEVNSLYGSYTPDKALDGNMNTEYRSDASGEILFTVTFPAAIKVKKIKMAFRASNYTYAVDTALQGSNNGTTWATLLTTAAKPDDLTEFALTNTGEYTQYRLQFNATETGINLYQFEVSDYEVSTYSNKYTLSSGVPSVWHTGQIILIQTPANVDGLAVTGNTLNGVKINTILQASKRYELRYNGTSFDAKGV